uniref:Uncharacterized protein n=1 Tax=Columba livia TaxID=8932 RepID=R7VXQ1_COLLI
MPAHCRRFKFTAKLPWWVPQEDGDVEQHRGWTTLLHIPPATRRSQDGGMSQKSPISEPELRDSPAGTAQTPPNLPHQGQTRLQQSRGRPSHKLDPDQMFPC